MILGILRETKKGENRVICTPKEVETITTAGHTVYAQRGCGERAGFSDEAYESAGALLTDSVQELFKVTPLPPPGHKSPQYANTPFPGASGGGWR